MTTQPEFTPELIAEILARPGQARDRLANEEVGYPLTRGFRLNYSRGNFDEDWLQQGGFPRDVFGEWLLHFPVGESSEGRQAIGLADSKPNPRRYGGLSFAQALVKALELQAEIEALPERTLDDIGKAYVEHLRASGNSAAAEAEADLQLFFQVNRNADVYFAAFPYIGGNTWRMALFSHLSGRAYRLVAPGDRPRVLAIVNRIFRYLVAACDHGYAAGNSGLTSTPWRRFKPLLLPEERAAKEKIKAARRAQRDAELSAAIAKYRERQALREEAVALGVIADKKAAKKRAAIKPIAYTVASAAAALGGLPPETIEKWIASGKLASVNVDGEVLIPAAALADLLKK